MLPEIPYSYIYYSKLPKLIMEDGLGYLIGWSSQYLANTIVCVPPFCQKVEVYTFPFHWTGYCYWTLVILLTLRSYLPLHLMKQRCFLAVVVKRLALINRFVVPNEEENVQLYVTVKFWDSYTVWHCVTSVPCLFHSLWSNLDLALWKTKYLQQHGGGGGRRISSSIPFGKNLLKQCSNRYF